MPQTVEVSDSDEKAAIAVLSRHEGTAVCLQAEKLRVKKQKAKSFTDNKNKGKATKNSGRWN